MIILWFCLSTLVAASGSVNVLDLAIDGLPDRFFPNVSLGLENLDHASHQCLSSGELRPSTHTVKHALTYTPNRRLQSQTYDDAKDQRLQLGIVLVVGGHSDAHYDYGPAGSINGLMAVWDSWVEHFFSRTSNTTSLVLLFDERDFKKQNHSDTKKQYLDSILVNNMGARPVDCVHNRIRLAGSGSTHNRGVYSKHGAAGGSHRRSGPHMTPIRPGCSNELHLDQGYRLYYIDVATANSTNQQPLILFAAVHRFPAPEWAEKEDEEQLFTHWRPFRLNRRYPTNYAYVKMTNWYAYHMLNLRVLDFFDYGGKLDNDVSFVAPFPEPNLPGRLARNGSMMMCTANGWYQDDPRICQGVWQCLSSYIDEESKRCTVSQLPAEGKLVAGGAGDGVFWENNLNTTFRAHFLTYWLGLYTAPETKRLARHWNDWHPRGMWDYRWGDQQWWPRPIAMFGSGDTLREVDHYEEINTDNGRYVVHKDWPRWGTIPKSLYFNAVNGTTRQSRDAIYKEASKKFIY